MSSEQEASNMPDGSHLMALTSFCKAQNLLVGFLRETDGIRTDMQHKKCLPCGLGRSWGAGRCRGDTRGCTCLCCRRQKWCCSASRRRVLGLWNILMHMAAFMCGLWAENTTTTKQENIHNMLLLLRLQIVHSLPEWKGNCCLASPVCASQMIVVWKIN